MRNTKGFTLVELLFVLAILAVLATAAVGSYTISVRKSHMADVYANLGNLVQREALSLSVHGHYSSTSTCEGPTCVYPLGSTVSNASLVPARWDVADAGYSLAGASDGPYVRGGPDQHGFDALRFLPTGGSSWCGYGVVSGNSAQDLPDTAQPLALALYENQPTSGDWFYAYALCDFDFDGTYAAITVSNRVRVSKDSVGPYVEGE